MSRNRSTIAISLSPRTIERVRAEADRCCVSVSAIVSLALADYLNKTEHCTALYVDTDSVKGWECECDSCTIPSTGL